MGLLDRARDYVASKDSNARWGFDTTTGEVRAVDASDFGFATNQFPGTTPDAGEEVTVQSAMRAAMGACIRLLADDISSLPWHAFRKAGKAREMIDSPAWMDRPNGGPWSTPEAHLSEAVVSLLSNGNLFLEGLPNTTVPRAINVLPPKGIEVERGADGYPVYIPIEGAPVDGSSIAHVPWISLPGDLRGLDMVEQAREFTGLELAARRWAGNFFQNGATTGGIILLPREGRKPSSEEIAGIRRQFEFKHKGNKKSWVTGVLTGGATIHEGTIKPGEAELAPLWVHVLEEACRFYHIPPHLLASEAGSSLGSNSEQRSIEYVKHALVPMLNRLETVYSRFIPGADTFVKFNVDALLRGDSKTRAQIRAIEIQNRVITRDEWRASEDRTPAPDGEGGYLDTPNNRTSDPALEDMSKLIRAGFDPVGSAAHVGISGIDHLGLNPTTQYLIEDDDPEDTASEGVPS